VNVLIYPSLACIAYALEAFAKAADERATERTETEPHLEEAR
jgi:hypothetical protein